MKHLCFWFALVFLSLNSAFAEVIRYRDDSGKIVYVDDLNKVPQKYRPSAEEKPSLPAINRSRSLSYETPLVNGRIGQRKSIEIFVTEWCPHCKTLERYLTDRQLNFTRYDIEKNAQGRKLFRQLGGGGVPVVRVGSEIIRGFSPEEIETAVTSP